VGGQCIHTAIATVSAVQFISERIKDD
jgi:hypothetical protein